MVATEHARTLARLAATAAQDKLATDLLAFDVSDRLALTDIFLLASAPNDRQVWAIVDAVEERMHREGYPISRREGDREARWVLLDFGDLVVHVQHQEERVFYQLERLWKDCPVVSLGLDGDQPETNPRVEVEPGDEPDPRGEDARVPQGEDGPGAQRDDEGAGAQLRAGGAAG